MTRDRYAADAYPAEHIQASTSAAYRPRVELRSSRCRLHRVIYDVHIARGECQVAGHRSTDLDRGFWSRGKLCLELLPLTLCTNNTLESPTGHAFGMLVVGRLQQKIKQETVGTWDTDWHPFRQTSQHNDLLSFDIFLLYFLTACVVLLMRLGI